MQSETNTNRYAADEFERLALRLESIGALAASDKARRSAAEIDLADAELQKCWGGAFNGQLFRTKIFEKVIELFKFDAIVETGTFRGITTSGIASRYSGPVLTCEVNKRYYLQAKENLAPYPNVAIELNDTVAFLSKLPEAYPPNSRILFYLDAHWYGHLPVVEELAIIQEYFPLSVVMIDDFQVPSDDGYGYDDYGAIGRLDLTLLMPFRKNAKFFFPSEGSVHETGAKRGTCVLAWDRRAISILRKAATLREARAEDWRISQGKRDSRAPSGDGNPIMGTVTAAELMGRFDELRHIFQHDFAARSSAFESSTGRLDELKHLVESDAASRRSVSEQFAGSLDRLKQLLEGDIGARSSASEQLAGRVDQLKDLIMRGNASILALSEELMTRVLGSLSDQLIPRFDKLQEIFSKELMERLDKAQTHQRSMGVALIKTQARADTVERELKQMEVELKRTEDLRQNEIHMLHRLTVDLEARLSHSETERDNLRDETTRTIADLTTRLHDTEAARDRLMRAASEQDVERGRLIKKLGAMEADLDRRAECVESLAKHKEDTEIMLTKTRGELQELEAERTVYLDELHRISAAYNRIANYPVILTARKVRSAVRKVAGALMPRSQDQ